MSRPALPPIPALLLSMVSLQGGAAFAKTLFGQVGPLGATALRVALAAMVLNLVFRPNLRNLRRSEWNLIVAFGVILGVMNLCIYSAFSLIPLGLAVTLEFMGPLMLALYLSRRPLDYLWVGLAALGILTITPHGAGTAHFNLLGAGLALLAGACWVAYILLGGRMKGIPSMVSVSLGMLIATLVTLPFGVAQAGAKLLEPRFILAGLAVAVLSSALPYSLELSALKVMPPRIFGVLMSLEPAIAALSGLLVLHEKLSLMQWLGMLCVMAASAGIALTGKTQVHAEPEPVN